MKRAYHSYPYGFTPLPSHLQGGLKLVAEKGNHRRMEVQQGSKMDVSDKKEQRKEIELDERWLKITTKGTPKTDLDCKRSCTLLLFEVLKFDMERVHLNVVGGDGENGLPEKMTCMEDSKWAIAVRAVAVYIFGSGRFETNKPILVKWRWNTLTQRFLQVVRNTKKAL